MAEEKPPEPSADYAEAGAALQRLLRTTHPQHPELTEAAGNVVQVALIALEAARRGTMGMVDSDDLAVIHDAHKRLLWKKERAWHYAIERRNGRNAVKIVKWMAAAADGDERVKLLTLIEPERIERTIAELERFGTAGRNKTTVITWQGVCWELLVLAGIKRPLKGKAKHDAVENLKERGR